MPLRILHMRRAEDRRYLREWFVLGLCCFLLVVVMASSRLTSGLDKLMYDWWLQSLPQPSNQGIVIVEIDSHSLEALGRWPWPREFHAAVIRRIASVGPKAVIYDLLFSEPSPADAVLAQAMSLAPVYLPLAVDTTSSQQRLGAATLPVPELRTAAAGIGHINLEPDRDGVVRGIALFEGNRQQMWPQLTLPAYQQIRGADARLQYARKRAGDIDDAHSHAPLQRSRRLLIPFPLAAHPYTRVSFAEVMRGQVDPEIFRNRIVMVGATADGLGEHLTTAMSGRNGPMSGIEVHASILDALLANHFISNAGVDATVALSMLPVTLLFAGFLVLAPRQSIVLLPVLTVLPFAISGLLLRYADIWVTPAPAIAAVVLVYPFWSWRRLEVAMGFIGNELEQLENEPLLVHDRRVAPASHAGNALERNIALMRHAARQLRDLKRFIWDSLNSLPDPVLVADTAGQILLANTPAQHYLADLAAGPLEGDSLQRLLGRLTFVRLVGTQDHATAIPTATWPTVLDTSQFAHMSIMERGVEVRDANGKDFVLRYSRCTNARNELIGWIANLTDVTTLHAAQRQRDEMLHLLSHDMRSPQSSIVALIEIERRKVQYAGVRLVYDRLERYARRTLALADSFVQLATAETREYDLEVVDFAELLYSAIDEVWPLANAKQIDIAFDIAPGEHPMLAERSMIARALVNLLNNATKYSPPQTRIECTLYRIGARPGQLQCVIRDHGYGIDDDQKQRLFERFQRMKVPGQPDTDGVGLGLTFVKTVIVRHGGTISCDSAPGKGTTMTLRLPCVIVPAHVDIDHM
ncbi:CHASE2 domain-containing protein [Burkholderia sp. BE17]|uniref:CHASE2 domain-containing protein n=1 Tax=Burkholderia sp. BE17 TaxID=2656644 RepID=UPI00128E2173|nr:CHASE2 domain-containing protein [Burkholderia sp. BE17]MPV68640.1 CHASE2 domain-containing protein [Burkholderia sp. BE17]